MTDREFLFFMANRLVGVYGESELVDFVRRLNSIAKTTDPSVTTDMFLFDPSNQVDHKTKYGILDGI